MAFFFLSFGLIAYFSAWVVNPGVALTLHAFDLAEWASLHPVVRAEPLLMTALLLRLPLLCFGVLFALSGARARGNMRLLYWLMAGAVALGLLPPLDFLTQFGNTNYQQQAVLAVIAGGVLVGSIVGIEKRYTFPLAVIAAGVGALSCLAGFSHADTLMRALGMPAGIGIGAGITPILFVVVIGMLIWQIRGSRVRGEQGSPSARTAPPF